MRRQRISSPGWFVLAALLLAGAGGSARAAAVVGQPAPAFTLNDQDGNAVSLAGLKGKTVVLEWNNPDCPFVQRHYAAGTMERLAAEHAGDGVVWLAVNSTHYMTRQDHAKFKAAEGLPYPVLDDSNGEVGRLYGARTTPHMFVVDADGVLRYNGAIDDDKRGDAESPTNHVDQALKELLAGKPVSESETTPYGCTVKYAPR